jgi:alkylation response protein AidB-like acyl-CoA dehydrogenase
MIQTLSRRLATDLFADGSVALSDDLRTAITNDRDTADRDRRLPQALAERLRVAGAFGLLTPVERGGLELPLATTMEVHEAFARVDAGVAWNVWNGNIGFAAALLDESAADRIWDLDVDPIIANSARVAGTATIDGDDLVLSGRWDMVSAIDIADWVALFAMVVHAGTPHMIDGHPDVRVCFLPVSDIQVVDTWQSTGMRSSGSKTVIARMVRVPAQLTVSPFAPARIDRALYRIPAFTLASAGAAPIMVGVAQAALDELISLAPTKPGDLGAMLRDRSDVQNAIGSMVVSLEAARLLLLRCAADIDAAADRIGSVDGVLRARLRAAMSHAMVVGRQTLSTCQLLASSSAIYVSNPMERIVRDGQVLALHKVLAPIHFDILGRLSTGLDAGVPVF